MASLSTYFNVYYDVALSFSNAGIGAGVMLIPVVTQFLLEWYGWRGALLLIGGLNLNLLVCGCTLRASARNVSITSAVHLANEHHTHQQRSLSNIARSIGLSAFKDMEFLSLMILVSGAGYIIVGWTVYLVPHALDIGFHSYYAALLSTVGGLGHVVGCVIFPLVAKVLSNKQMLYGITVLNSASLLLDPVSSAYSSYGGLMLSCVTLGVGRAIIIIVLFRVLNEVVDDDIKTTVIPWTYFFESCGSLLSGFLSGVYNIIVKIRF